MTFQEWQATRKWCDDLNEAECYFFGVGYIYGSGDFIAVDLLGGFIVPITNTEARFDNLAEAEAYLWKEWSHDEING